MMIIKRRKVKLKELPLDMVILLMTVYLNNHEAWTLGKTCRCFRDAFDRSMCKILDRMMKSSRKTMFRLMFREQVSISKVYEDRMRSKVESMDMVRMVEDAVSKGKGSIRVTIPNNKVSKSVVRKHLERCGIRERKGNDQLIFYTTSTRHSNECIAKHSTCICGSGVCVFDVVLTNMLSQVFEFKVT